MAYTTQYIGSRYVPLFAEPAEWDSTRTYEPLTIVIHEGNSYTSRQYVPVGIEITNEKFWALTGNYNAQVELYRRDVATLGEHVTTNTNNIATNTSNIATNTNNIATNTSNIATNTKNIATNTNDIATNTNKIATNTNDIAAINQRVDNIEVEYCKCYNNVAEMQADSDLQNGMIVRTSGFYSAGDCGGAFYAVSNSGTHNGMDVLECQNGLSASLIYESEMCVSQFGAHCDATNDDTVYIQQAVNKVKSVCFPGNSTIVINGTVSLSTYTILDMNNSTLKHTDDNSEPMFQIGNIGGNRLEGNVLKNAYVESTTKPFFAGYNAIFTTIEQVRAIGFTSAPYAIMFANGFNNTVEKVFLQGSESNSGYGIQYTNVDSDISGIKNVTNTAIRDCLIQRFDTAFRFDMVSGGSADTTQIINTGFSKNNTDCYFGNNTNDVYMQNVRTEVCVNQFVKNIGANLTIDSMHAYDSMLFNNEKSIILNGSITAFATSSGKKIVVSNTGTIKMNTGNFNIWAKYDSSVASPSEQITQYQQIRKYESVTQVPNNLPNYLIPLIVQTSYINFTDAISLLNKPDNYIIYVIRDGSNSIAYNGSVISSYTDAGKAGTVTPLIYSNGSLRVFS